MHHRHLHSSASAPHRRSCSHSRRRCCRPLDGLEPRHQRDSRRDNLRKRLPCEMCLARSPQDTPRLRLSMSSLRNLVVSWLVACSSALLHWLSSHSNSFSIHYLVVSTRSPFRAVKTRHTLWCCVSFGPSPVTGPCPKGRPGRAAQTTARRRSDRAPERRTSDSSASPRCRAPTACFPTLQKIRA